jgi:hypothetical protein
MERRLALTHPQENIVVREYTLRHGLRHQGATQPTEFPRGQVAAQRLAGEITLGDA